MHRQHADAVEPCVRDGRQCPNQLKALFLDGRVRRFRISIRNSLNAMSCTSLRK